MNAVANQHPKANTRVCSWPIQLFRHPIEDVYLNRSVLPNNLTYNKKEPNLIKKNSGFASKASL
jgi:hypothetical protein